MEKSNLLPHQKTLKYSIPAIRQRCICNIERGTPSANIEIDFPCAVENMQDFREALEDVFKEILEMCK